MQGHTLTVIHSYFFSHDTRVPAFFYKTKPLTDFKALVDLKPLTDLTVLKPLKDLTPFSMFNF
jgi:hypothetical protein